MIALKEAQRIFYEKILNLPQASEMLRVRDACNRILATDVASPMDMPPFDRAAMDGYAVMDGSLNSEYTLIDSVRAGYASAKSLTPGSCIQIMTGAPVPVGTRLVIPVELTDKTPSGMRITTASRNANISPAGEDIKKGDIIARSGDHLDIITLSLLISCGIETIAVRPKVNVGVLSTGDELIDSMADFFPGKIFDSNGPMLCNLAQSFGAHLTLFERIPDRLDFTIRMLQKAIDQNDIVFLSGGVSAGEYDFIPKAIESCGLKIHFSRLCIKPGKPMTFASSGDRFILAFPGNPVSSFLMAYLFGAPAIRARSGSHIVPRFVLTPLAGSFKRKSADRLEFVPARFQTEGLAPVEFHGSAHFAALRTIDGFFTIEPEVDFYHAGEVVPFWPICSNPFSVKAT